MKLRSNLGEAYSPLYFLAALGNGGLSVSFFIYLLFMVPHKGRPLTTFEDLWAVLTGDSLPAALLVVAAVAAIAWFAVGHFRLLAWNLREYRAFKRTAAFEHLRQSNGEVGLMAIPLTLAMSVNTLFILGAVFVPGLWSVVEYLFPLALVAFGAIGVYALRLFTDYFTRIVVCGCFDNKANNNLSQLIAVFAFTMIGVGFAAPAAMSHVKASVIVGATMAIFFLATATFFFVLKVVIGFKDMLEHGISREASPSLWIFIPILTVTGIGLLRINHGLDGLFGGHGQAGYFLTTTVLFALQVLFGLLGWATMRKLGYFEEYVTGAGRSPISYALICPGVAFFVFGNFFLSVGLVKSGVIAPFSVIYFVLLAPLVWVQWKTIATLSALNVKLLGRPAGEGGFATSA